MESGRRRKNRPELRLGRFFFLLCSLALVSCPRGPSTFVGARNDIDAKLAKAAPAKEREAAFSAAQKLAHSSTEWLSLLRRAELSEKIAPATSAGGADYGRAARTADAAVRSVPLPADLRFAAAHAFLRSRPSKPEKAIALFNSDFKPESAPELFSEAFLMLYAENRLPPFWRTAEYFGLAARTAGQPQLYLDAAALALAGGDTFSSEAWLRLAQAGGFDGPDSMLWNLGLYRELAARDDSGADPVRLRILGDAAWLSGQRELAVSRWQRSLSRGTAGGEGWKSYASLGAMYEADEAAAAAKAASLGLGSGQGQLADGSASSYIEIPEPAAVYAADSAAKAAAVRTEACYSAMIAEYPASLGAATVYAERLARKGRPQEGLKLLEDALKAAEGRNRASLAGRKAESASRGPAGGSADASGESDTLYSRAAKTRLIIGAEVWPASVFAAEALKAIEKNPDDGALLSAVLESLLEKGRYADFCAVEKKSGSRTYPNSWFYQGAALMLKGKIEDAQAVIEERGRGKSEPAASFALGRIYALEGDWNASAAAFNAARAAARSPAERCASLKGMGRAREKLGDASAARVYYLAAHDADPSDIEAALLSRTSQ